MSQVLVVGVETQEDGSAKVYIDARWRGLYALIEDPAIAASVQRQWDASFTGHLFIDIDMPPDDCLRIDNE